MVDIAVSSVADDVDDGLQSRKNEGQSIGVSSRVYRKRPIATVMSIDRNRCFFF